MKKNEKRLCWNCDADVSLHLEQCPYCGADLNQPQERKIPYESLGSPFQQAPTTPFVEKDNFAVSNEEWKNALDEQDLPEEDAKSGRREVIALLLLLPGVVFCLFALLLFFFSNDGTLTLHWNQNMAYFYFLGAIPLIYLGWRAISR